MIDLHCHILPGIDDGAADLGVSLGIAEASVADGVSVLACTPHILPGLYHNSGPQIRRAVEELQIALDQEGIPLRLVTGADNHVVPDFVAGLQSGRLLSLADSRYVLVEPPHHTEPPHLEDFFFNLLVSGFVPILTHPERLTWVPSRYEFIQRLVQAGVWMQITAGSLTGAFGRTAQYLAHRMLDEGCVHILATDAHDCEKRPPRLSRGRDYAARRVGDVEAEHLVETRPRGVVANAAPSDLPMPQSVDASGGWGVGDVSAEPRNGGYRKRSDGWRASADRDPSGGKRGLVGRLRHLIGGRNERS
jgi:protein-tyrosine phosphatase